MKNYLLVNRALAAEKKHLLLNQLFGTEGSPNQTGETLTRENRIGLMSYLRRTLMLLTVLTLSMANIGMAWGASVVATYSHSSSTLQPVSFSSNDYFDAMTIATTGTVGGSSTTGARCNIAGSSTTTITFTFTAKSDFNIDGFTFASYVNSDDVKNPVITYKKNSSSPTTVSPAKVLPKNSEGNTEVTLGSAVSMTDNDVLTISVNITNSTGSTRMWVIHTITLSVSASSASRTFTSDDEIYFKDASGNISGMDCLWKVGNGGKVFAYFYNSNEDYAWAECGDKIDGEWDKANTIYRCTVPKKGGESHTWSNVIFTRGTAGTFGSGYYGQQTAIQTPNVGYNLFTISTAAADGNSRYNGTWSRYANGPAICGDMNRWLPDGGYFYFPDASDQGTVYMNLEAGEKYEFLVYENFTKRGNSGSITNTVYSWWGFPVDGANCTITAGEAGEYAFKWNNSSKTLGVYYPQARLTPGEYIYFDARDNSTWKAADFDARFCFKYYDSDGNQSNKDCTKANATDTWVYNTTVPEDAYIGHVQMNRMVSGSQNGAANDLFARDRSSSAPNCIKLNASNNSTSWTTYCPPMNTLVMADNGTTTYGTGDGTSGNPYIVAPSSTIKVHVTSATTVPDDPNMTKYYQFKNGSSSIGSESTSTEATQTAGSDGTTHTIIVEGRNKYNDAESTVKKCTLYYAAKTIYDITYNKGSYGTGTSPIVDKKIKGVNITLRGVTYTRTGYTQTAWNTNSAGTGGTSYALSGSYAANAAVTLYPTWTAKTTSVTLNPNTDNHGTGSNVVATATFDGTALSGFTAATPASGYALEGYYTGATSGDKILNADGSYVKNTTYTTNDGTPKWKSEDASLTLYAHYVPTYTVTYKRNGGASGADGDVTGTTTDANSPYVSGSKVTGLANGFTNSGYKFKWWNKNYGGDGMDVYAGEKFTISANTNLYAQWEQVASGWAFWCGDAMNETYTDISGNGVTMRLTRTNVDYNTDLTTTYTEVNKQSDVLRHAKVLAIDTKNTDYLTINFTGGEAINSLKLGVCNKNGTKEMLVIYSTTADFSSGEGEKVAHNTSKFDQSTKAVIDFSPSTPNKYLYARVYMQLDEAVYDQTGGSGNIIRIYSIKAQAGSSCSAPTSPTITGTTSYTAGGTISLTASATGTSGSTTYTWYKGATWVAASTEDPVQAESTSGATFTKASCVVGDAGTYWCNISNGTGCEVQVSQAITVACASHSVILNNSGSVTGGTFTTNSATVCVGETATLTATPSSGYTFTSWSATGTGSSLSSTTTNPATLTMGTADVTVNATFSPQVYSITYKDQGDAAFSGTHETGYPTTHTYASATTLKTASKTGYTFGGWYKLSACTGDPVTSLGTTEYTADITLYAKWTIHSHTLAWDFAGGSTSATEGDDYTAGGSVNYGTDLDYPSDGSMSRSGYAFNGWSTDASTMPDEDLTITAQWTRVYTVTYVYNGADGGSRPENATGASVTLPEPTKTGYTLDGWYTTAGAKVDDGGETYSPTADITLYARWTETCSGGGGGSTTLFAWTKGTATEDISISGNGSESLTTSNRGTMSTGTSIYAKNSSASNKNLNHDAKGYKLGSNEVYIEIQGTSNFAAGDVVSVQGYDNASGANYFAISKSTLTHVGNATESDTVRTTAIDSDSEEIYDATLKTSIAGEKIHIFRMPGSSMFVKKITVTRSGGGSPSACNKVLYHGNGAESGYIYDPSVYDDGDNPVVLGNIAANGVPFVKDGFVFQGWANGSAHAAAGTVDFTAASIAAGTAVISGIGDDVDLYAVWADAVTTYTVTYADGGATGDVPVDASSPYEEGATVTVLDKGSLAKTGYSFAGWNDGSTDYYADGTFTMPAEDVTLTAVWTPNTYDITYHENGASYKAGYTAPATYTVGTGATLPIAANMTNTGYTFGGWFADDDLETGGVKTEVGTSEYGNKEFWAKWTENTYTVTYSANGGTGDAMSNTVGHYVTLSTNTYTKSDYIFAGWNTATDGSGASYSEGEEIELKANLDLYAIWAADYTITWDAKAKLSGVAVTPNLGGGNYTITASVATWTGSLTTSMISAETSGVTITGVSVDNSASPKTITATFNVGASVVGDKISFTLDVPANGSFSAKSDTEDFDIDRCTGSGSGSDGVLFSAEFKDSGLGASDICTAANTPYTFTTAELKAAPTGGSIKAFSTSNLSHMKYATNAISIAGSDGVIQIDLTNAVATNDLFTYVNVNSSTSAAYLRHTSPTNTTDQIALTVYNKETKVRLTSGFNGQSTLYIVRNNNDFKLHKAAVVRPAFLMLLRDDTPTSTTNLQGDDVELTTSTYLTTIQGGRAYFNSPSSGNLKIYRSSSKNYINFINVAGYIKVVLDDALQEDDVIGFDSYNTNNLALTTTDVRSTSIVTTNQLYTVEESSDLKGKTTFYIWRYGSTSDYLRGLQIARSGAVGGGSGSDKITTTLSWDPALNTDPNWDSGNNRLNKETGDVDFTFAAVQDKNSLGILMYSSSNTSVATVNASGKVHIVGAAGDATITATMAASGCYKEATASYVIRVTDNCSDTPGTITARDLECEGTELTVSGHTGEDAGATYQWYKDGVSMGGGYTAAKCTVTVAGEYYVIVTNTGDGHCAMASTNTVTVEAGSSVTAAKIVDEWYVKNGRRTPDIALVQTEGAESFIVKSGDSPITTFAGCAFYLGTDGIIYLKGQKEDGSAPTGLTSGEETLKFTATACGGNSSELSITIHKQESTTRPSVAFVVDGTKGGAFDAEDEDHSVNTELYQYLDYGADVTGAFDLTGQNVYSTVDEQAIREHYSQFDAILITDDPSTDTKSGKKSYVDAFGTMIDVRPMLTMEAFVSKWGNWKAKGVDGNPESPNPRQYKMKLQCKDHAIFKDLSVGTNVETETIDGVEYWTVTMVDNTKSPYSGVADGTDTDTKPALQGFSADDVSSLLLLGEISGGSLYAGVERQEETAARLMLLGLNAKALPNALTPEGKKVIENALKYLIETDLEKVDDCSNYFTGATDTDWNKDSNWSKGHVPNSPNVRVRILSECVINSGTYKVAEVDIATSGKSINKAGEMTGKLTINADAALIVGGKIHTAEAPYFNTGDLKPTTEEDLVINTSSTAQAALIFNNDAGDTQATVNYYSKGYLNGLYQFQYFAVPMNYVNINPVFADEYNGVRIYTYAWDEPSNGWERRGYYSEFNAFEGLAITTTSNAPKDYAMTGNLASTAEREITLTHSGTGDNIIGNSWMAPINIASLVDAFSADESVEKTVYIYCAGNDTTDGDNGEDFNTDEVEVAGQWLSIPMGLTEFSKWDGLKVIPAMQAYLIKVTDETMLTLNYDEMVRSTAETALNEELRAPKRRTVHNEDKTLTRLRVADSRTHTDLYFVEGDVFSDAFDNGWEATYMPNEGASPQFYAMGVKGKMAVLATDDFEGTVVGFEPGKETAYTISFSGASNGYYLNDVKTRTSTLIVDGGTYSFENEAGDDANRFIISATPFEKPGIATGVTDLDADAPKVQKIIYNDKLYIIRGGKVYSAEGQVVK